MRPQPQAGPRALIHISYAGMFLFGLILLLMGSLLPSLPHLSNAQAGALGAIPLAGILVSTVVTGPLLDHLGPRPVLAAGFLLAAGGMGALPRMAGFHGLAAAALVYGLGGGVLNTATNAVVSILAAGGRAAALNRLGACFSLGAVSAPLLMLALLSLTAHPALWALNLLALLTLLLAVSVLVLHFPAASPSIAPFRVSLAALRYPMVWMMGLLLLFESGNENTLFVWAGRLAQLTAGAGARQAEALLIGLSAALGLGRLLASLKLDSRHSRLLLLASAALIAAGAGLAGISPALPHPLGWLTGALLLLGLGMATVFPTVLALAGGLFPQHTGTIFSALMTLGLIGGATAPRLAASLAHSGAAGILFIPLADAAFLLLFSWLIVRRPAPSRPA